MKRMLSAKALAVGFGLASLTLGLGAAEPYLTFPVDNRNTPPEEKCYVDFCAADGEVLHSAVLPIAADGKGAWTGTVDLRAWQGRDVSVKLVKGPGERLRFLKPSPVRGDPPDLGREPNRLQFHFSPPVGYMNDPNGLVCKDGEWRMFYQHAPYTFASPWKGSSQYWGCATSRDLVHWTDHGDVMKPYPGQYNLISGSGVVDVDNTAGFGTGAHVNCVVGGSPKGGGLLLFVSTDGRTFAPDPSNPHQCARQGFGGDPKVIWHAPTKRWIAVTWGVKENCCVQHFHSSPDLRNWTYESTYYGDHYASRKRASFLFECPGLAELKIAGERETAWVVWGAGALYAVGAFDGHVFTPLRDHERLLAYPQSQNLPYYAGQAFQSAPDGRCVYIPWYMLQGDGPHFAQHMGLPVDLALVRTNAGLRLTRTPVRELEALRDGESVPFDAFRGELVEGRVSVAATRTTRVVLDLRGVSLVYDAASERLACAGEKVWWPLRDGRLELRFFLDRQGLECFSTSGLDCWAFRGAKPQADKLTLSARATDAQTADFAAWKLKSIWR